MRSSSLSLYEKNLHSMLTTQDNWQQAANRLSTGKRIMKPSDDSVGSARAVRLKQANDRNQQLQTARKDAATLLSRQESILSDVTKVIQNIKSTLVRAGQEGLADSDRHALKTELESFKQQLISLANSTDGNGRYVFAGYISDKPPFEISDPKTNKVEYKGGDIPIQVAIDDSRQVSISHTGSAAFGNIFESIDDGIKALGEDSRELLGKASRGMDNALENNSTVRAESGVILAEIDNLLEIGENAGMNYELEISGIEDVDAYTAIAEFLTLRASLEASQKTFLYMQNMALFQMKS